MKRMTIITILSAFASAAGAADAPVRSAQSASIVAVPSWYVAARGGFSFASFNSLDAVNARVTGIVGTRDPKSAAFGSIAAGWQMPTLPVRLEIEGTLRDKSSYRIDTVGACPAAQCGANINFNGYNSIKVRPNTLMLNAFYDWKISSMFTLFAGAGIGVADARSSAVQRYTVLQFPANGVLVGAIWPSKSTTNLSYSLTAGVSAAVTQNMTLEVGAHYIDFGRYKTGINPNLFRDESFSALASAIEAFAGLRVSF